MGVITPKKELKRYLGSERRAFCSHDVSWVLVAELGRLSSISQIAKIFSPRSSLNGDRKRHEILGTSGAREQHKTAAAVAEEASPPPLAGSQSKSPNKDPHNSATAPSEQNLLGAAPLADEPNMHD